MKKNFFGSLVATTVAGVLAGGLAFGEDAAKPDAGATPKKGKDKGKCVANECKGTVMKADGTPAGNSCKGKKVAGITKDECTKDGKGTWK